MQLNRLKELSAAGYPVALAPEQMLELVNELEALRECVSQLKIATFDAYWSESDRISALSAIFDSYPDITGPG